MPTGQEAATAMLQAMPRTLMFGAHVVAVNTVPKLHGGKAWGFYVSIEARIDIEEVMPNPSRLALTFMHECMHVILHGHLLTSQGEVCDHVTEEVLCDQVTEGLLSFYANNPTVLVWLQQCLAWRPGL